MARTRRFHPTRTLRRLRSALRDADPTALGVRTVGLVALLCLLVLAAPVMAGTTAGGSGTADDVVASGGTSAGPALASLEAPADEAAPLRDTADPRTGSFGQSTYTTTAGDLVEIDVSVDNGPAYVVVGGDTLSDGTSTGFLDILRVDGDRTITVNTRLLGTNASTDEVYATDGGTVDSYAHSDEWGPATHINETAFSELTLENEEGDEMDNLESLRSNASVGYNPAPLAPQRYRLLLGYGDTLSVADDTVSLEHRLDRSDLRLTQPQFRERVDVYTALSDDIADAESVDDILGPARERDEITSGDHVILGLEATGIWGALAARSSDGSLESSGSLDADVLHDLVTGEDGSIRGEGVTLTVRQTNGGMNERSTDLDLAEADPNDVTLLYGPPEDLDGHGDGPSPSALYLAIDTGADAAFTDSVEPGDEYAVEFAIEGTAGDRYRFHRPDGGAGEPFAPVSATDDGVDEQFPYLGTADEGLSTTATFAVRERSLSFDDRAEDVVLVENASTATLSGTTTLHPETELTAEFVADADGASFVDSRPVEITENDTFTVQTDLSGVPPGSPVSLELYDGSQLYDTRSLVVTDDVENPASFVIAESPQTVTVTRGDTLGNLSVVVRNDGQAEGTDQLSLAANGGEFEADQEVQIRSGRSSTVTFSETVVDLEPGEYAYVVEIDGDETVGRLVVEPNPDGESSEADAEDEGTMTDDPDSAEGTESESVGNESDPDESGDASLPDTDADGTTGTDADGPTDTDGDSDADSPDDTDSPDDADTDDSENTDASTEDADGTDDEDEPAERASIPLPLGIGTREAFGGTVVVGAMYVAGHWV